MGSIPPIYNPFDSYGPPPPSYFNYNPHNNNGGSSSSSRKFVDGTGAMDGAPGPPPGLSMNDGNFDIMEWHPAYQSCQKFFLDHAQYEPGTLAVCALINIRLPHQWMGFPVTSSTPTPSSSSSGGYGPGAGTTFNFNAFARQGNTNNNGFASSSARAMNDRPPSFVSPVPYIRRLVVTGFDKPAILHGFFGDDYKKGIMPHVECERRNYLFAAKHGGWSTCKRDYDVGSGGGGDETCPFMKPLDEANMEELQAAEKAWSSWLAMEDWMVGPRAPADEEDPIPSARSVTRGGGVSMRDGGLPDGI